MRKLYFSLLFVGLPFAAACRMVPAATYQQMYQMADLVVIARPTTTTETAERGKLPGGPTTWRVVGLSTVLDVRLVLKGDTAVKQCTLHHYRQADPREDLKDGPNFVSFDHKAAKNFLLFLKREADGRFAPVTGQEDPALYSVIELKGRAN